jgi:hypothetical protein
MAEYRLGPRVPVSQFQAITAYTDNDSVPENYPQSQTGVHSYLSVENS